MGQPQTPLMCYGRALITQLTLCYQGQRLGTIEPVGRIGSSPHGGTQKIQLQDVNGQLSWHKRSYSPPSWVLFTLLPKNPCDVYFRCGSFAICTPYTSPPCGCLSGFIPRSLKHWESGDHAEGCVRRTPLRCSNNNSTDGEKDGFLMVYNVRLPENSMSLVVKSTEECESVCLKDCLCTAYSYNSGCLVWNEDLMNLKQFSGDGGGSDVLQLRMASSELRGSKKRKHISVKVVLVIIVAMVILMCAITVMISRIRRKRLNRRNSTIQGFPVPYRYKDLQNATKNFSEKLGKGGFGSVYKGTLCDSSVVAVKKFEGLGQGDKQFRMEVSSMAAIQHVNIVQLLGFCCKDSSTHNKKRHALLTILLITAIVLIILLSACYFGWKRLKPQEGHRKTSRVVVRDDMNTTDYFEREKSITELPLLDFSTVLTATDNFSTTNELGEGGFGPGYKGKLLNGQEIAVKRLSKRSGQGFQEFKNEIELIAELQHTNLVRLLGWYIYGDEKLFAYEYLPNKSLEKFIFDPKLSKELNWGQRYRIIEGITQGLLYLHRYSRLRVIHRDLKTSNILLDAAMNPKNSDFGLARIFRGNQAEANTNKVVGMYGYMAPEYALDGLFSEKSDVFSFGVIILEIITGKRSIGFYPYKESLNLLGYVWKLWEEGRGLDLTDQSIGSSFPATEVDKCVQVGLLCVQENAADRQTMSSVALLLGDENATLPTPRKPGFAIRRHPSPVAANFPHAPMCSLNELSISAEEER